jgi:DNA polymerase-3 subunit beta
MEGEADFEIPAETLRGMVEWTVFAAARENTRYAINGVLWEQDKGVLTLVATDGRRLSLIAAEVTRSGGTPVHAIVPVKAIQLFQRIASEDGDSVRVKLVGNQILLRTQRATMSSALVEGHFPRYQEVIPTDSNKVLHVDTQEFLSAVRRAALLTNEESRGVRLSITSQQMKLASRAPEQGEAEITIPVQYKGDDLDIGFNPNFLVDVLRAVRTDEVAFELKEPNRPGILRVGPRQLYVVMPLNLS